MIDIAIYNSIFNCIHCLLKKVEFSLKMAPKKESKHVAGSNNVRYIFEY